MNGIIQGTLWDDKDGNGVFDGTEQATGIRPVLLFSVQQGMVPPGLNASDPRGLLLQTINSDVKGNYAFTNLPDGTYRVSRTFPAGFGFSNDGGKGYIEVTLKTPVQLGPIATVNIGSKPLAPPVPPSTSPVWKNGIGAVEWLSKVAPDDATADSKKKLITSLKLSMLRAFSVPCQPGGHLSLSDIPSIQRLTSRGIKFVGMHGAPEKDPKNTTFVEDDYKKYFDGLAAARADNPLYLVELQNEINLDQYWPAGDQATKIKAALMVARVARASLGPKAFIIGPSIGWEAGVQPHLDYQKAMLDGGLLNYVSAINTHLYFTKAAQVDQILSAYRSWIPKDFPIYLTETNLNGSNVSNYASTAQPIFALFQKYGVTPFVYRLGPTGSNSMDHIDLTDAGGAINSPVAKAWGLI